MMGHQPRTVRKFGAGGSASASAGRISPLWVAEPARRTCHGSHKHPAWQTVVAIRTRRGLQTLTGVEIGIHLPVKTPARG